MPSSNEPAAQLAGLITRRAIFASPEAVARALAIPDLSVVINCAAYTAVDRAEQEPERAFAVNATGAADVAQMAAARCLPIIHLSTDYVYAGAGAAALDEDEPIAL